MLSSIHGCTAGGHASNIDAGVQHVRSQCYADVQLYRPLRYPTIMVRITAHLSGIHQPLIQHIGPTFMRASAVTDLHRGEGIPLRSRYQLTGPISLGKPKQTLLIVSDRTTGLTLIFCFPYRHIFDCSPYVACIICQYYEEGLKRRLRGMVEINTLTYLHILGAFGGPLSLLALWGRQGLPVSLKQQAG